MGFPGGSDSKESTCSAGDLSSIPGSGNSPGEGIGYPLQYSWASLVAQLVKNLLAKQETQVQPLVQEDPLEKEMETHSSILAWEISWTEESGGLQSMASQRVRRDLAIHNNKHESWPEGSISLTRDQTWAPCIGAQCLSH